MATKKLTKSQLELEEKKLEIQERKQALKEAKVKLEFEKDYINIERADQLRMALSTNYVINTNGNPTHESGFSDSEFMILMKKYYEILNKL